MQLGCPFSRDPSDKRAGTGGPRPESTFLDLARGYTETRFGGSIRDEHKSRDSNRKRRAARDPRAPGGGSLGARRGTAPSARAQTGTVLREKKRLAC